MTEVVNFAFSYDWTRVIAGACACVLFFAFRWQIRTYHCVASSRRVRPSKAEPIDLRAEALRVGPLPSWEETRRTK